MTPTVNVKWCKKNLEHHSQAVYDLLSSAHPEFEMTVEECTETCGLCTDVPFAIRNNAVIVARDARGLYAKLAQGTSFIEKPALPGTYTDVMAKHQVGATEPDNE